jgi:hypothetical protein
MMIEIPNGRVTFKVSDNALEVNMKKDDSLAKLTVRSDSGFTFDGTGNMMFTRSKPVLGYHDGKITMSTPNNDAGIQFPCSIEDKDKLIDFFIGTLGN